MKAIIYWSGGENKRLKATEKYLNGVSALGPVYHLKFFCLFSIDCSLSSPGKTAVFHSGCLNVCISLQRFLSQFLYFVNMKQNYILGNTCIRYFFTLNVAFVGVMIGFLSRNFAVNVNKMCSVDKALQPPLKSSRKSGIYWISLYLYCVHTSLYLNVQLLVKTDFSK